MQIEELKNLKLLTGARGLQNTIGGIGILDYEYAEASRGLVWKFRKRDFVLSSLLFAKNDPDVLMPALQGLVEDGISALAIKTIYYSELPPEVVKYADKVGLPIFLFGRDDAYFEEIIVVVNERIRANAQSEWIEQRIQTILRNGTNRIDTSVFAKELLPKEQTSFCVAYYATQAGPDRNAAGNISEAMLKNLQTIAERCYRYESGCLLIFCEDASGAGDALEKRAQMRLQCYLADGVVGVSAVHARPDELVFAFIEAMSSVEYCRLHALPMASFQNIGIYRLLLPYCHDYWMCQYCESLLESLCGKDGQLEEELLQTALLYLRLQGNVPQIAQQLHLHENTVRYRMRKLQARLEHVHAWNDGALKLILCYYELKKRALPW